MVLTTTFRKAKKAIWASGRERLPDGPDSIPGYPSQPTYAGDVLEMGCPQRPMAAKTFDRREAIKGCLRLLVISLPLIVGSLLAWTPLFKISLKEAMQSKFVVVNMVSGAVEAAIGLVTFAVALAFVLTARQDDAKIPVLKSYLPLHMMRIFYNKMPCFLASFFFFSHIVLVVSPMCTGLATWNDVELLHCAADPTRIACRADTRLLRVISIFRAHSSPLAGFMVACYHLHRG